MSIPLGGPMRVKRGNGGGELSGLVREMTQQLKKMRIIDSQQMREMFLTYDCDRSGYIELEVRASLIVSYMVSRIDPACNSPGGNLLHIFAA